MRGYDVLIVGGGPAGSTCARQLNRAGFNVMLLDKASFPRDKTCAGWITPAVVEELGLDLDEYRREDRTSQLISGFRVALLEGPEVSVDYGSTVSYGIRRCEFDDYLLRRSGADLLLGEPVRTLRREAGQWVVNDRYHAPMLVGAGGHFCPVARLLGADVGRGEPATAAQEVEFVLDEARLANCQVSAGQPRLYFMPELLGYGWCFRKGNYLNVGLGCQDSHRLAERVNRFADGLELQGVIPRGSSRDFRGHAYLLYDRSSRRVYDEGVMLIGDAAGLAYPESGEGIRPAVESALLAAAVIIDAEGDYSRERLLRYHEALVQRFGPRASGAQRAGPWLPGVRRKLVRRLLASPWFVQHVLLDRWFLRSGRPPLQD